MPVRFHTGERYYSMLNTMKLVPIDKDHLEDLWPDTAKAIQRLNLRYMVAKVPAESTEPWLSEGGLVIFKFWAVRHPSVKAYSGNNPDVI